MHQPLAGVKMIEVAQFTFTPAAGGVLTEWGADVIKVEHSERGDAQRGMVNHPKDGTFHPIMEHPNRGKRSIGLDLANPAGYAVLLELLRDADVFLTNFLPDARRRLGLELEDIRKVNPDIIYVRGSAHGQRGPWAEKGGYDGSSFWCRMGSAWGVTPPDSPRVLSMPGGAYGDSMGGMTIAGGIAAALYGRATTGEPSVVDVSLMSVGAWAFALDLSNAALTGPEKEPISINQMMANAPLNPTVGHFRTSDGRWINFTMIQPFRYFADVCRHLGLDELIDDERFNTAQNLMANARDAAQYITEAIAQKPFDYWSRHLQTLEGPWAPVQGPLDILDDPQMAANGYIRPVVDSEGKERRLIANPVQFDAQPPETARGPLFAEHTDDLLRELGHSEEEILELKIAGAAT
ncbi:CoA transferase [Frankia sp. CNm7]|uniref:CoA transferase n=1 Tax=Frankia nepalensis TaxID=1836974 RepID=A0A937UMS5_9ACTN|nr:CoA transferase [Frankia nepalensis]MBL7500020.1 CoA transferase [Frankia nepalensis]MBL7510634.1 CoA transferase [Frankia nepalensis]MBL7520785.1 CoA transferase [Frankia nepalensis]MBL7627167.1 CoA transferase [Frankia nepalensis]